MAAAVEAVASMEAAVDTASKGYISWQPHISPKGEIRSAAVDMDFRNEQKNR